VDPLPPRLRPFPDMTGMAPLVADSPWEAYAQGSDGQHFSDTCAVLLEQSVDEWAGEPLALEGWQLGQLGEALSYDEHGRPYWASVVLVVPRKNGKTTMLAAYGIYRLLWDEGQPEVLLAASSDRQAGRLFDAAVGFIRRSEYLLERLVVREYIGEISRRDGGGRMLRMSSDHRALHGYNPSLVIPDELAQWTTPGLARAWAALTTAGGARRRAQVFAISTAGEAIHRHDSILGRLIDRNEADGELERPHQGLTISRNHQARTLLYRYESPSTEVTDVAAHKLANPASWITSAWLERQAKNPELSAADFLQLHCNVWAATDDTWLAPMQWAALADPGRILEDGEEVCLGFDGSRHQDATALVGCTADGHVFTIKVWERPEGAARWEVTSADVDAEVYAAMERWTVRRAYLDPPLWQSEIDTWAREFGSAIVPWATNRPTPMSAACERFRTDALAGAFSHDADPTLRRHVLAARLERTRSGHVLTRAQRGGPDHIDGAIAAVLAYEARADALAAGEFGRRYRVMSF
jgi:phage terminase large subunit-like protein